MLIVFTALLIVSVVALNAYRNVISKQAHEKQLFTFYSFTISNAIILLIFLCFNWYKTSSLLTTGVMYKNMLMTNTPFLILYGIFFVCMKQLYAHIVDTFPLSIGVLALQITPFFTASLYFALGDPIYLNNIIGIFLISFGAVVSSCKKITIPNIIKSFEDIPKNLYFFALCYAITFSLKTVIIFIVSYLDKYTLALQKHLDPLLDANYDFITPLQFFISSILFSNIIYLFAMLYTYKKKVTQISDYFWKEKNEIIIGTLVTLGYSLAYFTAYSFFTDKIILTGIIKLTLPLTLFASYLILKEEITLPRKVGMALIILGNIVNMF